MNTGGPQRLDSLPGVGLHHVGDDDMSGILPADGHVDDGAYAVTGDVRHAQPVHQLVVAGGYLHAVHFGDDAAAADLLNIRHPAAVDLPAIGRCRLLLMGWLEALSARAAYSTSFSFSIS